MAVPENATPEGAAPGTGKPKWTRLASLALILVGLAPLIMFGAGLLWGLEVSEDAGFFLVTGGLALIAAGLVARFGTWAKVLGAVIAFLVGGALFWTAFGLFTPNSFFDFIPGVLVIPGAIVAIVACVGALRAGRRGDLTDRPMAGERTAIRIVLGVVLVAAVGSAALTFLGSSDAEGSGDVEVAASDFEFDPQTFEVPAGGSILVRNDDPFLHTFTVDDLDVDEALSPGSSVLIEVPEGSGDYVFYCQPHTSDPDDPSGDDMAGTLTVE